MALERGDITNVTVYLTHHSVHSVWIVSTARYKVSKHMLQGPIAHIMRSYKLLQTNG